VVNMVLTLADNARTKREISVVIGKCFMSKITEVQEFGNELLKELKDYPDTITRESIVSRLEFARRKFKNAKTEETQESYGLFESAIEQELQIFDSQN